VSEIHSMSLDQFTRRETLTRIKTHFDYYSALFEISNYLAKFTP
jgi:hypothetical protein